MNVRESYSRALEQGTLDQRRGNGAEQLVADLSLPDSPERKLICPLAAFSVQKIQITAIIFL